MNSAVFESRAARWCRVASPVCARPLVTLAALLVGASVAPGASLASAFPRGGVRLWWLGTFRLSSLECFLGHPDRGGGLQRGRAPGHPDSPPGLA